MLYSKSKAGFHTMPRDRARALSRRGTRAITGLADDYAFVYGLHRGSGETGRP
jgi:hypothetical protein